MLLEQRKLVVSMISGAKAVYLRSKFSSCNPKDMFKEVNSLLSADLGLKLPTDSHVKSELANKFADFFHDKIEAIRQGFTNTDCNQATTVDGEHRFTQFRLLLSDELLKLINKGPAKSCRLDPLPTWLLRDEGVVSAVLPLMLRCVNESLENGLVPECLKTALVTPILKKPGLDCNVLKNYRPISNLPFVSKVIEKAVAQQLVAHMRLNGLEDPLQSAHSTETALVKIKADVDAALDKGKGVILILLDMSAAFDTISHEVLLRRLEHGLGITGKALEWFKSYLSLRTQAVMVQGQRSDLKPLVSGVPQGSVLGPLLFSIYIRPLGDIVDSHHMHCHGFADDVQLYDTFDCTPAGLQAAITKAEACVKDVRNWLTPNHLKGNDDKTEFLIISPQRKMSRLKPLPSIQIGTAAIPASEQVRNLGAQFDSIMSMSCQVSKTVQGVYFQIHRISKIRRHLDDVTCARVINALVTSRLDFQNSLLLGLPQCQVERLQKAQNAAARLLTRTKKRQHITPIPMDLHWLPVRARIDYKVMLLTHKVIHNQLSPGYLRELLCLRQPGRRLRSSNDPWLLAIPRSKGVFGDRSLCVAAPGLWNSLPRWMRALSDTEAFRGQLKTLLFNTYFEL